MKKALVLVSVLFASFTASAANHSATHLKQEDTKRAVCKEQANVGDSAYRLNNLQLVEQGEDLLLSFDVSLLTCKFDDVNGYQLVASSLPTSRTYAVANENGPNVIKHEMSAYQFVIYDQADFGTAQANRLNTKDTVQTVYYVISGGVASVKTAPQTISAFMSFTQKTYANGELIDAGPKAGGVFNIQLR